MDIKTSLGIVLPVHFSYFDPSKDWFDLGSLFILVGLILSYSMFKLYIHRFRKAKPRLKREYYVEIRWWLTMVKGMTTSFCLVIVIKFILILLGLNAH